MKIFILTRFNIKLRFGGRGRRIRNIDATRNFKYLNNRFKLFEKYTLPSVFNQIDKDFIWIVMFSSNTPSDFKKRIDNYAKQFLNFIPLYIDDNCSFEYTEEIQRVINDKIGKQELVITARLDNDDCICNNYISELRKEISKCNYMPREKGIIYFFDNGYQYSIRNKVVLQYKDMTNHFCAMATTQNYNVLMWDHTKISQVFKTIHITGEPIWMEIIHDSNAANEMKLKDYKLIKNTEKIDNMCVELDINCNNFIRGKMFLQRTILRPLITVWRFGLFEVCQDIKNKVLKN